MLRTLKQAATNLFSTKAIFSSVQMEKDIVKSLRETGNISELLNYLSEGDVIFDSHCLELGAVSKSRGGEIIVEMKQHGLSIMLGSESTTEFVCTPYKYNMRSMEAQMLHSAILNEFYDSPERGYNNEEEYFTGVAG